MLIDYNKQIDTLAEYIRPEKNYPLLFGKSVDWNIILLIESKLKNIITADTIPYPRRLRAVVEFIKLLKPLNFSAKSSVELTDNFAVAVIKKYTKKYRTQNKFTANKSLLFMMFCGFFPAFFDISKTRYDNTLLNRIKNLYSLGLLFAKCAFGVGHIRIAGATGNVILRKSVEFTMPIETTAYLETYFLTKLGSQSFFLKTAYNYEFENGLKFLVLKQSVELYLSALMDINMRAGIESQNSVSAVRLDYLKKIIKITEFYYEHLQTETRVFAKLKKLLIESDNPESIG